MCFVLVEDYVEHGENDKSQAQRSDKPPEDYGHEGFLYFGA